MKRSFETIILSISVGPLFLFSTEKTEPAKRSPAHTINREVQIESLDGVAPGDRTTLTGDWYGARSKLFDNGVYLTA